MSQQTICKHDDPKTWVTPFAFDVSPNILYLPLASPLKRGLAMMIDGLLVAVLAETAGWMFILLVLVTLLIQKQSQQLGKIFKWALYIIMLLGLLSAVIGYYTDGDEQMQSVNQQLSQIQPLAGDDAIAGGDVGLEGDAKGNFNSVMDIVGYMPAIIAASQCHDLACAQERISGLQAALVHSKLNSYEQRQIMTNVVNDLPLTLAEKQQLLPDTFERIETNEVTAADIGQGTVSSSSDMSKNQGRSHQSELERGLISQSQNLENLAQNLEQQNADLQNKYADINAPIEAGQAKADDEDSNTSPLAWIKGLLNDLGLGFGWAAFYFTVFTAWFDGQTLGKKLFGIRVIQLDGVKISLWAAFGRYGGYAAGFTTGLLGFVQIYWDANRQAIQDKISATVVIDLRKTRHQAALEHQSAETKDVNLSLNNGADI